MAMEGNDATEITHATLKILESCILTPIEVRKLPMFDIEYLFLQLRGKSVGETITLYMTHPEGECKHRTEVDVKIDDIKVQGEVKENKVMLTDDIGVVLRYPLISDVATTNSEDAETLFKILANCIDYVFDGENVYNDFTADEIDEWLSSLNQNQFGKLVEFFQNIPKLSHKLEWDCTACGKHEEIVLEGLQSFFT
jgi:hypothetical protein